MDKDNNRTQSWSSYMEDKFNTVYQASVDLVNRGRENLRLYGKLLGALDLH